MPDRIFPTTAKESLGSEKEFVGINLDFVSEKMVEAASAPKTASNEELLQRIAELNKELFANDEDEEVVVAKKELPAALEEYKFKKKDEEKEDDGEPVEEQLDDTREGKEAATARKRRIAFVSEDQISVEALKAAEAAGDTELHKAILAARNEYRIAKASQLYDGVKDKLEREAKAAKRNQYRVSVVKKAEEAKQVLASAKSDATAATDSGETFKKVSAMSTDERQALAARAIAQGFPKEYVEHMFGRFEPEITAEEKSIRDVMAAELPKETKIAAVSGLVKTAKLDSENIARLKRYWKEELGYGDEAWIDDLFTTKYD